MSEPWFRRLDDIEGGDLACVGRKAFRLATLRRHGLPVPPGLVITARFFEEQIKQLAYTPLWAGSPDVAVTENALLFLADTLKTKPLARPLAREFQAQLDRSFPAAVEHFAVRSSAIDEDRQSHSFAGIHLTELAVPRSALTVSLTRCWASALSEPALHYRREHGLPIQAIKIAVLIQPMLRPASAGVGFTLNPATGARDELLIEANWNGGGAVVSGRVKPYQYRLAKRPPYYPILGREAGSEPGPAGGPADPLSEPQLRQMAEQMEQIEALMGQPQDVEWIWEGDRFFVVQTRPAQAMPRVDLPAIDVEWTRGNYRESLPELPSPLFVSLLERTQNRALTFFSQMGLDPYGVGPFIKSVYGRPCLNLTMLKRVTGQIGLLPRGVLQAFGYARPEGQPQEAIAIDWETMWTARRALARLIRAGLQAEKPVKEFEAAVAALPQTLPPFRLETSPAELLAQFRERERIYGDLLHVTLILVGGIAGLGALAARLIEPLTESAADLVNTLAALGTTPLVTRQNRMLLQLGQAARLEPRVGAYFAENNGDFANYRQALAGTEFLHLFETMLANEGDRALYEADMGWPRFSDDPTPLLRIIRRYATADSLASPPEAERRQTESIKRTWRDLSKQTTGLDRILPWRQALALPLIHRLSRLLILRERLRTAQARAMAGIRRWDLNLARHWVKVGWLDRPEDYFWLTMEEIERAILAETEAGITLRPLVNARQATYAVNETIRVPNVLHESDIPDLSQASPAATEPLAGVLTGLPISPGQVQGRVIVLRRPEDLPQLAEDTILVTPSTDPIWFPLFPLAKGLIVEMGGLLSHGSIIAREYGLTAVANIPDAMNRLRTGDRVLVDGSTGVVQILEQAPPPARFGD